MVSKTNPLRDLKRWLSEEFPDAEVGVYSSLYGVAIGLKFYKVSDGFPDDGYYELFVVHKQFIGTDWKFSDIFEWVTKTNELKRKRGIHG